MDDITSFSHRRLATILRNPDHPHHAAAKAERDRRRMTREGLSSFKNFDEATYTDSGWQKPKKDTMSDADAMKKAKDLAKKAVILTKSASAVGKPVKEVSDEMKARYIRAADGSHRAAHKNEREAIRANDPEKAKKFKDIMKKRNAGMTKAFGEGVTETKGAPKGYHFTRDGKLKKGDAGADGDGGAKLRSDPLDKQRSKIPPIPEKFANPAQQAAVMAKLKKSGKYDGKESFGRANLLSRLKSKGMDVDKMHSNNMKDADAAKKRSAAAEKDLADYRKKTGVTSESKDEKFEPHMMYDPKTGEGKMAKVEADHIRMKKMGWGHDKPKLDEISMDTLSSYKDKAKYSRDKAQNSAAANYMRGTKGSGGKNDPDIKTMQKRDRGKELYYSNITNKLRKQLSNTNKEATIPDGQTIMTKGDPVKKNDMDKLAKIRKMLDREKKK